MQLQIRLVPGEALKVGRSECQPEAMNKMESSEPAVEDKTPALRLQGEDINCPRDGQTQPFSGRHSSPDQNFPLPN